MKKLAILLMVLTAAGVFAQDERTRSNRRQPESDPPATVTVSGTLALANGRIALQSENDVYYVAGIQRLIGFVEGLKEGAQASLEGYVHPFQREENAKLLFVTKLTIGNKSYDLASNFTGWKPGQGRRGRMGGFGAYGGPMHYGRGAMPCREFAGQGWGRDPGGRPGRQNFRNNNRR
jgi:hypothetical protein